MSNKIIKVQGSKSIINRILIISTFLDKSLHLKNYSQCSDVITAEKNLESLGLHFQQRADNSVVVTPQKIVDADLFVEDAGTAFRFLAVRLASMPGRKFSIDISQQLKARPHKILYQLLHDFGSISSDQFPWQISGKELAGGKIALSAEVSSQFISALLLSAPAFRLGLNLSLSGQVVSRSYIAMSLKLMEQFGIKSEFSEAEINIEAGQSYHNPRTFCIEPDYSTLCYFWAWAVLQKQELTTIGNPTESLQADAKFYQILKKLGAEVQITSQRLTIKAQQLRGGMFNLRSMPDQVPTLAVLALFAEDKIIIEEIAHLRYKESDRISALLTELGKLTNISYQAGKLCIEPLQKLPQKEICLNCYDDHRLIMAFSILQKMVPQLKLDKVDAVKKSAPDFFENLAKL
ncbi:MAG: 3-phosphoshikimate 1-carboxyvinyltransferase [Candidatus Cloacimonadales bacterium]